MAEKWVMQAISCGGAGMILSLGLRFFPTAIQTPVVSEWTMRKPMRDRLRASVTSILNNICTAA
jgi:hypothetical protein